MNKALGVVLLVVLLTVLPAAPASAHATLLESTPGESMVVGRGPAEVVLRYDQPVSTAFGAVKVLAPDGSRVDEGKVSTRDGGRTVVESLRANLASGTYTILWRVLSQDSHTLFGAVTFSVKQASATGAASAAAAAQATEGRAAENLLGVSRLVLYLGLLVLVGGLAFLIVLWPAGRTARGAGQVLWASWHFAVLGSASCLLVQGPYSEGLPLYYAFDPELIVKVLQTPYGVATGARLILLAGVAVVLARLADGRRQVITVGACLLGGGLLVSTSVIGHAGDGPLAVLALPADVLHLAGAAAWLGGLALLAVVLLRRPSNDLQAVLPRWSRYAEFAVLVLVVTGTFAGWREVREVGALTGTTYGRLLLLKVALVVLMVALGAFGRSRVRRQFVLPVPTGGTMSRESVSRESVSSAGGTTLTAVEPLPAPPAVARLLRRNVLMEAGIAVVVLAVTALLVSTPPAKDSYFPMFEQSASVSGGVSVQVEVGPARVGLNDMHLSYTGDGGKAVDVVAVTARWTFLGGDDVVPVHLTRSGSGRYDLRRVELSTLGTWQLAVTTQTSDIDSTTTLLTVRIR